MNLLFFDKKIYIASLELAIQKKRKYIIYVNVININNYKSFIKKTIFKRLLEYQTFLGNFSLYEWNFRNFNIININKKKVLRYLLSILKTKWKCSLLNGSPHRVSLCSKLLFVTWIQFQRGSIQPFWLKSFYFAEGSRVVSLCERPF